MPTQRDAINVAMGRAQDPNADVYASAMGGAQDGDTSIGTPAPAPGAILPTAALNDIALQQGSSSGYHDLGAVSLPAGDWVIHIAAKLPASNSFDLPLFALTGAGTANGFLNGVSQMQLSFMPSGTSNSIDPARGSLVLSGKDDAGNWLSPNTNRAISAFYGASGSNVRYIQGPYMAIPDAVPQSIFIQKVNQVVQLWTVAPGQEPILHDYANTNFGAMTTTANYLGRMPNAAGRAVNAVMQRFFACAGSLTADQMAAIAQGVDPRQYLAFNQPSDRLTSLQNIGATAQPDLVGSGAITLAAGNHVVGVAIVPTTVTAEMPRVRFENDQIVQRTGPVSDLLLSGSVTGIDDDIYVQLVDFTTKSTVVKPWTLAGRSINGKWAGVMPGIQTAFQWFDVQLRKGTGGTVYTLNRRFSIGILPDHWGQSIGEKERSTTAATITGPAAGFLSFFSRAKSDSGSTQGNQQRGWKRTNTQGYGEVHTARLIAEAAGCPVGMVMSAMEGSAINAWGRGNTTAYEPMADTWRRTRPGYAIWLQGQGNTGTNPGTYTAFLDTLLQQTREDFPWSWKFIMAPLNNNGATANNAGAFTAIRNAQSDWADANAGPRLSNAGGFNDLRLSDTVHPSPDLLGQARIAERIARQILWMEGIVPTSARGPRFSGAVRSGATIDLTVTHNGGTALQVPYAGDITGFRASTSSTFGTLLTISSAVVLDATTIRLTLSADPGAPVYVDYQWGNPGATTTPLDANGFIPGVTNPVYDNRSPGLNAALGFPVQFTAAPLLTVDGGTFTPASTLPDAKWGVPYNASLATTAPDGTAAAGLPRGLVGIVSGGLLTVTGTPN